MQRVPYVIALLTTAAAAWLALVPPGGLTPEETGAAALILFTVGLLATGVVPEYLTALVFFLLAMLFGVAAADVVFAGFKSAALWLVFGGLIVGVAVGRTGLGGRIAHAIAGRLGSSYMGIIGGVAVVSVAISFLMPSSMGRVVLLIPIVTALAERFGFTPGSNGHVGIVLATLFGTFLPAMAILPANVPNMVMVGASETLYGYVPTYGSYLLLHFPVLGLVKTLLIIGLVCVMFPDRPRRPEHESHHSSMSKGERRLTVILVVALALWATDFAHHVSPAWVALAAGIVCLLPPVGLIPTEEFARKVNFGSLFYVAGLLGVGSVFATSGIGDRLGALFLGSLDLGPGSEFKTFAAMGAISAILGPIATQPGIAAVMTPLAGHAAELSGLPIASVVMMQVLGFSTVILPYQAPPLVVGMGLGGVTMAQGTRFALAMTVLTILIVLPLDFFWWWLLGWL